MPNQKPSKQTKFNRPSVYRCVFLSVKYESRVAVGFEACFSYAAINYTHHDASTAQNVTGKTNPMKQSHVTQESQMVQPKALGRQFTTVFTMSYMGLQCFDAVGWVAGRASGL